MIAINIVISSEYDYGCSSEPFGLRCFRLSCCENTLHTCLDRAGGRSGSEPTPSTSQSLLALRSASFFPPLMVRCHYEVLEVERDITDDELKKAYRKLALKVRLHT